METLAYIVQDDQLSGTPQSSYQITQEDVGKPLSEIQKEYLIHYIKPICIGI